jgi:predicted ATPase
MIENIALTNFRKFTKFSLRLKVGNILVGPNNAGKSSILDAFRMLDVCFRYTKSKNPTRRSVAGFGLVYCYEIPESAFPFSMANISFNYINEVSTIEFRHQNQARATILVESDGRIKFFVETEAGRPSTGRAFRAAFPVDFVMVPTLSPLEADEPYLTDETVQKNSHNRLASRVLRNIWYRRPAAEFAEFSSAIEDAWLGIKIKKPELDMGSRAHLRMYFSENKMDREVHWSGFGFQAWLQIQTHLRRATDNGLLIIDEPDVYLHPDLQKRLLSDIRSRFPQFIMATHAVEMINDAEPEEIVSINNAFRSGRRIKTEGEYQAIYRYIGSGENAAFSRLAKARKVIFVEGDDEKIIRRIARRLGLDFLADPQLVPIIKLGGFNEWTKARGAAWAIGSVLDLEIKIKCIFDRDYRSDLEIADFKNERDAEGMSCHVWERKEIENYLLTPEALRRAVNSRLAERSSPLLSLAEVNRLLDEAIGKVCDDAQSQLIGHAIRYAKKTHVRDDESAIAKR